MAQPLSAGPQAMGTITGRQHLLAAVNNFINLLSPQQRATLTQTGGDFVGLTKALQDKRVSEKRINRCEAFLQSVQQFSGIVDTMIQHDPVISALIWGSIKILFLTAQNFVQYFSELTKLLERVGQLWPIFKEFQELWPQSQGLQDAVLEYYAQIVDFCANAIEFLRSSGARMVLKAMLRPVQNEFQDAEQKLLFQQKIVEYQIILAKEDEERKARQQQVLFNTELERKFDVGVSLLRRLEAGENGNERQLQLQKIGDNVLQLERRRDAQKKYDDRQKLLKRISNYDHTEIFLDCANTSHPRTGEWLYEMHEYKEWVQSPVPSLLWCYGIPGSGKSVLATSVVKHLLDTCLKQASRTSG
ncbi:hypothetical protein BDZ91DRAFT_845495, partial [Kalaharituber pfeilii]